MTRPAPGGGSGREQSARPGAADSVPVGADGLPLDTEGDGTGMTRCKTVDQVLAVVLSPPQGGDDGAGE